MESGNRSERQITLFSETDVHGIMIFANDNFCTISKYSLKELIGQPHNIIRHPDMPKQLFRMMWTTLERGEVFRAVIKNKAKDGSHYWVNAVIMPIFDRDRKILKYVGVRHLISDEKQAVILFEKQRSILNLDGGAIL